MAAALNPYPLHTPRLLLRPWAPADRPALMRMTGDAAMMRYITGGEPLSDTDSEALLARQQACLDAHGICMGAVELRTSGEVIGLVGLQPLDSGEFEIGWWIWKAHWGQGYATEAARPYVEHARGVMGLASLAAVIDPDNGASIQVARQLGMQFAARCSARDTAARRPDVPVLVYRMDLGRSE